MRTKRATIYGLPEFGLTLGQLSALGGTRIKLRAYFRHLDEGPLFKLRPSQRNERIKNHYETLLSRVKRKWNAGGLEISCIGNQPRGFGANVEARRVSELLRMPEISDIWLDEIPGRKRRCPSPRKIWFAVRARFAIQVEGQTTGLQTYEDRIVLIRAFSPEDAKRMLRPEFRRYGRPYLNPDGLMVRWAFERVLDVYEILEEAIDPRGTEVFSALAHRRMKP